MPDVYPVLDTLPQEWLVPPHEQPHYTDLDVTLTTDLGSALSDAHVAAGAGGHTAIIYHEAGQSYTYADLARLSEEVALFLLGLGIRPGERVAFKGTNRPEFIIAAIGAWKIGAVVVPVPVLARETELTFYLRDTEPALLLFQAGCEDADMVVRVARAVGVRHLAAFGEDPVPDGVVRWGEPHAAAVPTERPEVPLDSVAIVWHTGGTTGTPKGCYHTQRRYLLAGHSLGRGAGVAPGQRWLAAAPIGHALGMIHSTIFTLLHGATLVMVERFTDPRALLDAIREHEVTTFTAIAASWAGMLDAIRAGAPAPTSLRRGYAMWQSSTSSEVIEGWRALGITLLNNYGSTAFATWPLIPQGPVPQGSLGSPAPGFEVRVLRTVDAGHTGPREDVKPGEVGQLAIRGVSGLTYWRLPEKQRTDVRDGWTIADDLVVEEDGNYLYLGRTDFLISSAGNKIAPGEVEQVLSTHEAVEEVAVIGLPDPIRQEAVSAFVVLAPGYEPSDALRRELQNLVKSTLSPYKYPRNLEFIDALPRDHVGKVMPKVLREQALARMGVSS